MVMCACTEFDTGFFVRWEGGILTPDSISGQDIGICMFIYFFNPQSHT